MIDPGVPEDWWPESLISMKSQSTLDNEHMIVAEISQPWGQSSYMKLHSVLAPPESTDELLTYKGGIGWDISSNGPHPTISKLDEHSQFTPRFWVQAQGVISEDLEPLSISWTSSNHTYISPDQGFLMTYGLVPRFIKTSEDPEIRWDDPSVPRADVVVSKPLSLYEFPFQSRAFISIHRDYLQDYATIRGRNIIQVFYVERRGEPTEYIQTLLDERKVRTFYLPGRTIEIRIMQDMSPPYLAKVWGSRSLIGPSSSPVTTARWEYGELIWPGFDDPVTYEAEMSPTLSYVYVRDTVLSKYEGRTEFSIHPESGGLSYRSQWSTGNTQRVCRDLIRVELNKLYESAPPEVVHHFHIHAVQPPIGLFQDLRIVPNVASRTRRIVYSLVTLGETLASITSEILGTPVSSEDTVGLCRTELDYQGWWEFPTIEPVARHIPKNLTKDDFLARCEVLDQLIIEGFSEKILRMSLLKLGIDRDEIKDLGSLKLLSMFLALCKVSNESGLEISKDIDEIFSRLSSEGWVNSLPILFSLHNLRMIRAHRGGKSHAKRLNEALDLLEIDIVSTASGWGHVLDKLYDAIAQEIDDADSLLQLMSA